MGVRGSQMYEVTFLQAVPKSIVNRVEIMVMKPVRLQIYVFVDLKVHNIQ